jgi:thiamine kinase
MNSARDPALAAAVAWASRGLGLRQPSFEALTGGLSNRSFRLQDGGRDFVLRIGGGADASYGISRASELAALSAAAHADLAPPPVLADAERGLLVTEYVAGEPWTRDQARAPENVVRVARWLGELHRLAVPQGVQSVSLAASIASYLRHPALATAHLPLSRLQEHAEHREAEAHVDGRRVLCHHDLHHLNIIEGAGGMTVIDWEYAGRGDALADLASYACYHDLDAAGARTLLEAYAPALQPVPGPAFDATCWLFDCLWLLWIEIQCAADGPVDASLASRRLTLRERLGA